MTTNYLGPMPVPRLSPSVDCVKDLHLPSGITLNCEKMGFDELLPIQREVIPIIRGGCDVIGTSPTGTGKTVSLKIMSMDDAEKSDSLIKNRKKSCETGVFWGMCLF